MKRINVEVAVGVFVLLGILSLGYISVSLGELEVLKERYPLYANFSKIGGLTAGALVEIAGVPIGKVAGITLSEDYEARLELSVDGAVKIPDDAIASVKTKGLIGENFIEISPGASENFLKPGERILDTEPATDIMDLIKKYAVGAV